jgi:hypothetical protein
MTLVDAGCETSEPDTGGPGYLGRTNENNPAIGQANTRRLILEIQPSSRGPALNWTTVAGSLATCNDATLIVNGTRNTVNALGNCWAVTVMGSSNTVIADSVTHDITVYGYDQTVFYHNGAPIIWDRGRELGMTNRLQQVPG